MLEPEVTGIAGGKTKMTDVMTAKAMASPLTTPVLSQRRAKGEKTMNKTHDATAQGNRCGCALQRPFRLE